MPVNATRARQLLRNFDFRTLFIEELGWDRHSAPLEIVALGSPTPLSALAQKRGMVAYHCPAPSGQRLPDYAQRRKIEHQVSKTAHEHLIIFTDPASTMQVWQWVKREPGKPAACREHTFHSSHPGDALLQKLEAIAFSLDEEGTLSLTDVTRRARAGFDVERVTRRFYDQFQKEHAAFLKFISGIPERGDNEWYASVMLNRLMFVYFMQRKGFLDGDRDYLRNRLIRCRNENGRDKFHSFYRYFLLRLFHEGLGDRARNADLERLVGRVPYLNGGIFDVHELERPDRYGDNIQIPDEAFERIFNHFDQYHWHLDERPLRADNEINPDVLGYIFEKYVNQKEMGAYYTKEDITEYIGKNTVIPFLFDAARAKCRIAFENPSGSTVWDLLQNDPDRYIYPPVRHGITWKYDATHPQRGVPLEKSLELPDEIAAGINPPTLHQPVGEGPVLTLELRKGWNRPAPADYALPTETWREVIARCKRYEELRRTLAAGEVRDINDLITLNLDIRQFAQDVIENCEGPDLLRAFWHAIARLTILDPTCGSGAFLFAALNILEPLYEACLGRMAAFVDDLHRSGEKHRPEKYADFRKVLANVAAHPNRRYFILKSIILNNLFGVDIMEEAVEICKLRLFLKLTAQVEPDAAAENFGIEPLPDIDFNIRPGNTLVGYANYDEVKKAIMSKLDLANAMGKIAVKAADLQQTFDTFRQRQIEGDGSVPAEHKQELRQRLKALDEELNRHLAAEYDVKADDNAAYAKWLKSHQPFHWFIEFYGIMDSGGFDVIIGNPPYVELSKVLGYRVRNYATVDAGNLYNLCLERCGTLLARTGFLGVIVPLSGFSTERMKPYQDFIRDRFNTAAISYYSGDAHPSVLFDGVKYRLCIILGFANGSGANRVFASAYLRWYAIERPMLLSGKLDYGECNFTSGFLRFAKVGSSLATQILRKILYKKTTLNSYLRKAGKGHITYHRSPVFWIRSMDFEPYFSSPFKQRSTDHLKDLYVENMSLARRVGAVLNSTVFYFWFTAQGNCRNIAGPDVESFPIGYMDYATLEELEEMLARLMADLKHHSRRRVYNYKSGGRVEYDEFYPSRSKPIIDEIDHILARHYGFTEEQLDFIINYDIKYRLGGNSETEDE